MAKSKIKVFETENSIFFIYKEVNGKIHLNMEC